MEKIFEVTSAISTPLGLGGLFATIVFYIFKQILAKDFIKQLTTAHSAEVIKLIINKLFILALVAMILGFSSYLISKFSLNSPDKESNSNELEQKHPKITDIPLPTQESKTPTTPEVLTPLKKELPTESNNAKQAQPNNEGKIPSSTYLDSLNTEERYELITLAQEGCFFFSPGRSVIYNNLAEYIEPAHQKYIESLTDNDYINISGYAETGNPKPISERLSLARANAVKSYIISKYNNIDASHIATQGYGTNHNQKWVRGYLCGAQITKADPLTPSVEN